jgi:YidC/Oxa1 family membrane protein insertase
MQRLQPQMKELQKRYKDDKQRMNQELMKLYQEHQVNPLGSCLPLVLQLPFFLSLFYLQQSEGFRALVRDTGGALGVLGGGGPLDVAQAVTGGEQFLFIPDITKAPSGGVLIALIVIYVLTQLGSSTVSAMAMTDKNQKRLMFALPFLFVPFIINFPAGLLVYWITTNTWTIGQQLMIRKVLPPPHLKDEKDGEGAAEPVPGAPAEKRGLGKMIAEIREAAGVEKEEPDEGAKPSRSRDRSGTKASGGGAKAAGSGSGKKGASAKAGGGKAAGGAKAGGGKSAGGKFAGGARGKSDGAGANGAAKAEKKPAGDGGNGRTQKAPPPSPRKKKKRSGRRR